MLILPIEIKQMMRFRTQHKNTFLFVVPFGLCNVPFTIDSVAYADSFCI